MDATTTATARVHFEFEQAKFVGRGVLGNSLPNVAAAAPTLNE